MEKKSIISEYMGKIGRKGGQSNSPDKAAASRENARFGGRPPIPDDELTPAQKKRRARYLAKKAAEEAGNANQAAQDDKDGK